MNTEKLLLIRLIRIFFGKKIKYYTSSFFGQFFIELFEILNRKMQAEVENILDMDSNKMTNLALDEKMEKVS